VLVLDGAEVAATTMCDTRQCPVCTCPHQELDRTDKAYPYRHTEQVKAMVEAAQREHPDNQGRVKPLHQTKVYIYMVYDVYYIVHDIVYDIVCDIT
jgi:hypothetical protein